MTGGSQVAESALGELEALFRQFQVGDTAKRSGAGGGGRPGLTEVAQQ